MSDAIFKITNYRLYQNTVVSQRIDNCKLLENAPDVLCCTL